MQLGLIVWVETVKVYLRWGGIVLPIWVVFQKKPGIFKRAYTTLKISAKKLIGKESNESIELIEEAQKLFQRSGRKAKEPFENLLKEQQVG